MYNIWEYITNNFNNRELAGAFWLLLFVGFFSWNKDIRESGFGVIKLALASKLIILFGSLAIYTAIISIIAVNYGIIGSSQYSAVVVWYFLGGLPLFFRTFSAKRDTKHFRGYAKDAISGTAFLEFIYVAKTFSLVVELFLAPIIAFIAIMSAVAESDQKYVKVNKLLTGLLVIFAAVVFWNSVSQIWNQPDTFFVVDTYRSFILPIYLTIGSIPFFYCLFCYSKIETAITRIDLKTFQSDELKAYARKRFFLIFLVRPWLLDRAVRQFQSLPAEKNSHVDDIIDDILQYERDQENPPVVNQADGWSPFAAREFLTNEGLRTDDYHKSYDDLWWSGVASKNLDYGLLSSTANYSFEGDKNAVKQLRYKGHFNKDFVTEDGLDEFSRIGIILLQKTLAIVDKSLIEKMTDRKQFSVNLEQKNITLKREKFFNGYELILVVKQMGYQNL